MASYQGAYSKEPSYTSGATADKTTGLMLGLSIVSALFKREKITNWFEIEVPMYETMVDFTLVEHLYGYNFIPPKGDPIYPRQSSPNRKPYKTKDGYIAVLPYNDEQWLKIFKDYWKRKNFKKKKFSTLGSRNQNVDELYKVLSLELVKDTTKNWIRKVQKIRYTIYENEYPFDLFKDEHLKKLNFLEK